MKNFTIGAFLASSAAYAYNIISFKAIALLGINNAIGALYYIETLLLA